jgi:hypothetical protein
VAALEYVTYLDNLILAVEAVWNSYLAWGNTGILQYPIV